MEPNLLMQVWMMAHLYGAKYQAVVCYAGSSGEVAFRESLCPQYTSDRHDAKGLRTYHITGTCDGTSIRRIACGHIGCNIGGANTGLLQPGRGQSPLLMTAYPSHGGQPGRYNFRTLAEQPPCV